MESSFKSGFARLLTGWIGLQVLLGLAFLFVTIILVQYGRIASLDRAQNALVSIPITIAIFAVNFSFLEYQFSPYRGILERISGTHVVAATALLLAALAPLAALYTDWHFAMVCGVVIPVVTYASVGNNYLDSVTDLRYSGSRSNGAESHEGTPNSRTSNSVLHRS